MDTKEILKEIGLDNSKSQVYLALLELGAGTSAEIAQKAKMPRTTVHEILQFLNQLGIISYITKGRTRRYSAENPDSLLRLVESKKKKLEKIIPSLVLLFNSQKCKPVIRYFEGVEGVITVFEDTLTVKNKILLGILSMEDLYKIPGKDYMDDYIKRRVDLGIELRVIRSKQKEVEETWPASHKENRKLHYAPLGMVFPMTIYLYGNKVSIVSTEVENFGMIIESKDFYNTIKNLFEISWKLTSAEKIED